MVFHNIEGSYKLRKLKCMNQKKKKKKERKKKGIILKKKSPITFGNFKPFSQHLVESSDEKRIEI